MNCEIAHERIVASAYGELADELIHELERHMAGCPECEAERKQLLALKVLADAYPVAEPDANLVARSRLRLDEALDALPPRRWYERLGQRILNNFASMQAAPVAACLLLVAGAGAGAATSLPRIAPPARRTWQPPTRPPRRDCCRRPRQPR
jgi:anti-sigma factor RsiW